jgi:hypothetical protein
MLGAAQWFERGRKMSRLYEMRLMVTEYNDDRTDAIDCAIQNEWDWENVEWDGNELSATGQSNLCGGETDEQFATRLTLAI